MQADCDGTWKLKKMEIFEKYIVLGDRKQIGIIKGIYDEKGQKC